MATTSLAPLSGMIPMPQKMSPTLVLPESSMPVSSTDKKISRRATELCRLRTLRFKPSVSSRSVDHSPPRASRIPTAQMKPRTPASPMAAVAPSPALAHATAILTGRKSLHKTELLRLPETKPRPNQAGVFHTHSAITILHSQCFLLQEALYISHFSVPFYHSQRVIHYSYSPLQNSFS